MENALHQTTVISFTPSGNKPIFAQLLGFILHIGSIDSGHFATYCHHCKTNKWILYDENIIVDDASEAKLLCGSGYIFLYKHCSEKHYKHLVKVENEFEAKVMEKVSTLNLKCKNFNTLTKGEKDLLHKKLEDAIIRDDPKNRHMLYSNGQLREFALEYVENILFHMKVIQSEKSNTSVPKKETY